VPSITDYDQMLEAAAAARPVPVALLTAADEVLPELPVTLGIAEMVDYSNISVRRSFNGEDSNTDHGRSGARFSQL
jgi:hypothetical protein